MKVKIFCEPFRITNRTADQVAENLGEEVNKWIEANSSANIITMQFASDPDHLSCFKRYVQLR